jgi:hypothetical protein
MMPVMDAPAAPAGHLAHDLLRIHKVITRGISMIRGEGAPGPERRRGFIDFARCVLTSLRNHHDAEETVVFPRVQAIAAAPFARLEEEHRALVRHLDAGDAAIAAGAFAELRAVADQVEPLWLAHIAVEEACFTPEALDRALTPAQQAELGRLVGEHAQRTSQPAPLLLPFVIYSLDGADRAAMAARLPPPVTQQLIPGPWKAEWAPMAPYLII